MKCLGMLVVCGLCLVGCANDSAEPIEEVKVQLSEEELREQRIEQARQETAQRKEIEEQQKLEEIRSNNIEDELDRIINNIVDLFLTMPANMAKDHTDTLEEYYLITGKQITENEDHYNKLKEAYWNSLQEDGLCNNPFWNDNNDDCINKPDDAFARVEAYVNGKLSAELTEEIKNHVDEDSSQYAVQQPEQPKQQPQKEESYIDIVSEILDRDIEEGLTYDNFLLVGTVDFNSVKTINELFGFKGELVSEYGSHTVYQWEFREKKSFKDVGKLKIVTVGFDNGIAVSKNQVGL